MSSTGVNLVPILLAAGLPEPKREFYFASPRKWRFDLCWPARMLAVEIEGGSWTGGRHTQRAGYRKDVDKYNEAALLGWKVIRVTADMLRSGEAVALVERALRGERQS